MFCFLKLAKQISLISVDIACKALLTIQVDMFVFDGAHAGRELQQVEAFPVGTIRGHFFCSSQAGIPHRILYLDN